MIGYLAISAAAVLWAVGGTVASALIRRGAVVVELTQLRSWIALAGLALLVSLRRAPAPAQRPRLDSVVVFGLAIAAANFFYYASLQRLPVAVAIVLQYTAPAVVVLWIAVRDRRAPSRRVWRALVLAMLGVLALSELPAVIVSGRAHVDALGLGAAGGACLGFAVYMVVGERVGAALGADRAMLRAFLVSSIFWVLVALVRGLPRTPLQPRFLPWVIFLGLFTTLAPFVLFAWGLPRVGASRAGIVSTLEPLTAAVLAFVWLGQRLSIMQLAGAAMVVCGIALVQTERPVMLETSPID